MGFPKKRKIVSILTIILFLSLNAQTIRGETIMSTSWKVYAPTLISDFFTCEKDYDKLEIEISARFLEDEEASQISLVIAGNSSFLPWETFIVNYSDYSELEPPSIMYTKLEGRDSTYTFSITKGDYFNF